MDVKYLTFELSDLSKMLQIVKKPQGCLGKNSLSKRLLTFPNVFDQVVKFGTPLFFPHFIRKSIEILDIYF